MSADDEEIQRLIVLSTRFIDVIRRADLPGNWRATGHSDPYEWATTREGRQQISAHREASLHGLKDGDPEAQIRAYTDGTSVWGAYRKIQDVQPTNFGGRVRKFARELKGWADIGFYLIYPPDKASVPSTVGDANLIRWANSVPKVPTAAPAATAAERLMVLIGEYLQDVNEANAPDQQPENPRWQTQTGQIELARHRQNLRGELNAFCYGDVPAGCSEMVNEAYLSGQEPGKRANSLRDAINDWAQRGFAMVYRSRRATPTVLTTIATIGENGEPCDKLTAEAIEVMKTAYIERPSPVPANTLDVWEHEAGEIYKQLRDLATRARDFNSEPQKQAHSIAKKPPEQAYCFRLEGGMWVLKFNDESGIYPNHKGFRIIHTLLSRPNPTLPIAALELAGGDAWAAAVEHSAQDAADSQAIEAARERLDELNDKLARAERGNHKAKAAELGAEKTKIEEYLKQNTAPGWRARKIGSQNPLEAARSATSQAVKRALRLVIQKMPGLAEHLNANISTGVECAYRPHQPVDWHLE